MTVYGDECKFGGGKTLREGMGQQCGVGASAVLDTVITNALIVDYTGIYKADVGIKDGMIVGIGKAGNPDVMDGVTPGMVVGVNTEAIARRRAASSPPAGWTPTSTSSARRSQPRRSPRVSPPYSAAGPDPRRAPAPRRARRPLTT